MGKRQNTGKDRDYVQRDLEEPVEKVSTTSLTTPLSPPRRVRRTQRTS